MTHLAIIGGSGFYELPDMQDVEHRDIETQYGGVRIHQGALAGNRISFLSRHGENHKTLAHCVNYRANIAALAQLGVKKIIALNAVGSIASHITPGSFAVPDQVIDYTYGREHTFVDEESSLAQHIDFTYPFDEPLRLALHKAIEAQGYACTLGGVYACVQGPRLETAAEVRRLQNDGCDMVGMTLMPEAALAREKSISYASVCLSVNWAAGLTDEVISIESIVARLHKLNVQIREVLHTFCISQ